MFIFVLAISLFWIWREIVTTNVKAQFRLNCVKSTCVCPQLEANSFIPAGHCAFAVGVEPPPIKLRASFIAKTFRRGFTGYKRFFHVLWMVVWVAVGFRVGRYRF